MHFRLSALAATLVAGSIVNATQVTNLIVDISGGEGYGDCRTVVSFDDSPDVELVGCATTSDGVSVPTDLGDVVVKCDVEAGSSGTNQCLNQRVVCRDGCWCATIDMQSTNAACTIPDICSGDSCTICTEMVASNAPQDLTCS